MMLTIPVYSVGISCKLAFADVSSVLPTSKEANRRVRPGGDLPHKLAADRCSGRQYKRRKSSIVCSSAREGAAGPLKESAEKKMLLLKYVKEVQPALIEQFMELGPPAVVAAMRNTITNMLGTLPPQFFTVTISTVGENMSQLMLSVLMTGYMFRNAQYRLELRNALGSRGSAAAVGFADASVSGARVSYNSQSSSNSSMMQRSQSAPLQGTALDEDTYAPGVQKSRVQGDVLLWHKENGLETLEAVQYIELLEDEVKRLRQQLDKQQQHPQQQLQQQSGQPKLPPPGSAPQQEATSASESNALAKEHRQLPVPFNAAQHALQANHQHSGPAGGLLLLDEPANELLDYLRCLDAASMSELTGSAGPEVNAAMDSFVARLMGTNDKDSLSRAGSDCTAQELAKVMFWLMVVGYTLRGMEVRWDMERSVSSVAGRSSGVRMGWGSKDTGHDTW